MKLNGLLLFVLLLLVGCVSNNVTKGLRRVEPELNSPRTNTPPVLPRPKLASLSFPVRESSVFIVPTNRVRCTNNCPLPRTNIVMTWVGGSLGLAWDFSPSPNIVGYVVYQGTNSRRYSQAVNVGVSNQFKIVFPALYEGNNYFAITAVDANGLESDFSSELVYFAYKQWNVFNRSSLTNSSRVLATVATNSMTFLLTNQVNKLWAVGARGTNVAAKAQSDWLGMRIQ